MSKNKSGIWSFFASVRLAIILLFLIAFFALVGTLVPQREAALEWSSRLSPSLYSFLWRMQIFDLYHSVWFILLSGFLAVNLVICSLDRFGPAWRRFRRRQTPDNNDEAFQDPSEKNTLQSGLDMHHAADAAAALLKKKYRRVERVDKADEVAFCAQKGRFSIFGVYIVHLSILVLIAGAIIGSIFGIEGSVNISEGETVKGISLRSGNQELELPFSVRCDKFVVEFYENGMPKTFQSDLTFIRDGKIIHSGKLRVNHPVEVGGFRFYQASYGAATGGQATIALLRDGGRREVMNVAEGYTFELPGKEGAFRVLQMEENLMNMGPAIKVSVESPQAKEVFWVFREMAQIKKINPDIFEQHPIINPGLFRPYTFELLGLEEKYYTGLQVNRDPGTPAVAVGALLLIGGLMLVLFSYARTIWIRIRRADAGVFVSIAGRSYKNQEGLQKEMQYLLAQLKDILEKTK